MATHSSTLAWRIPGMGEPGGLQSMGSQRVGHDWATQQQQQWGCVTGVFRAYDKGWEITKKEVEGRCSKHILKGFVFYAKDLHILCLFFKHKLSMFTVQYFTTEKMLKKMYLHHPKLHSLSLHLSLSVSLSEQTGISLSLYLWTEIYVHTHSLSRTQGFSHLKYRMTIYSYH